MNQHACVPIRDVKTSLPGGSGRGLSFTVPCSRPVSSSLSPPDFRPSAVCFSTGHDNRTRKAKSLRKCLQGPTGGVPAGRLGSMMYQAPHEPFHMGKLTLIRTFRSRRHPQVTDEDRKVPRVRNHPGVTQEGSSRGWKAGSLAPEPSSHPVDTETGRRTSRPGRERP